ncbi:MAG: PstS family phosphate ABC transporter substrate-binding protein [Bacteroidetes bacterium]|nr:PstS family phosphate ABC transporter substrate-binding protein [Bacteroidota bacterium]
MKQMNFILIFTAFLMLSGCLQQSPPDNNSTGEAKLSGTISISGAFALYPITVLWAEEFQKLHPDVRIDISAGGAGKGMADALSKVVDLGMFSRNVTDQEKEKGAWYIAVTKDAVLPTTCASNKNLALLWKKGMTKEQFRKIFVSEEIKDWGLLFGVEAKESINIYTRSDACGAAEMWAQYLGGHQENLAGIGVFGDPGIADALKNDAQGIGFNNVNYVYDYRTKKKYPGLEVIPIDINENGVVDPGENFYGTIDEVLEAVKNGIYPSPPARELYFVSKGKPENKTAIEFLKWILNDGLQFLDEAGYVELSEERIVEEKEKLR